MSREGRSANDNALIERYYNEYPEYPCPCYTVGLHWCSACSEKVTSAVTRQGTRERIKEVLGGVGIRLFTGDEWDALCERIMEAV